MISPHKFANPNPEFNKPEDYEIIKKAQSGDNKALNEIIKRNTRMIYKYAFDLLNKNPSSSVQIDDLVQEGTLGLMYALRHFDCSRGIRLGTYAKMPITTFMRRFLIKNISVVGVTRKYIPLDVALDSKPAIDEIMNGASKEQCFEPKDTPEEDYIKQEFLEAFGKSIRTKPLSERHKEVFLEYYYSKRQPTYREVGKKYNISHERVRQLLQETMKEGVKNISKIR